MKFSNSLRSILWLSVVWSLCLLPCPRTASGGEFLDWLFGRNQPLIPIGSYPIPSNMVGQPVVANYPQAIPYPSPVPVGPSCASASIPGTLPAAPVQVLPPSSSSGTFVPTLPVYPPTTSQLPSSNFQSVWNRTPVTYYRPVTSVDPSSGATVTQLVPCTSYEYQTQRVPIYAFRPIFGQGRTFYPSPEMYWNPNATTPVASSGSSSFISVPQAGMPIETAMLMVSGSVLAGSLPPSFSTPIVPSNPVPSYLAPSTPPSYLAPATASPGYLAPATTSPSYIAPATSYAPSNAVPGYSSPSTSYDYGNLPNVYAPPIDSNNPVGTGVTPNVPNWNATPQSTTPSGAAGSIADPESSVQPSLPTQPLSGSSTGQYQSERPRFGLSRVHQQSEAANPFQSAPSTNSETSVSGQPNPNAIEIPNRLQPTRDRDDLKAIPAPEGSDLSPRWNRGLLDSRDLTASNTVSPQSMLSERAVYITSSTPTIASASAAERMTSTDQRQSSSSVEQRAHDAMAKKPGRLLSPSSHPAAPAVRSPQIDDRGWTAK